VKRLLKATALYALLLVVIPFLLLEGAFRLLPVASPPPLQPVTRSEPIAHFAPNSDYVYSAGWNFAIRSHKHANNYGFNNLADYHPEEHTPLFMVIGDSFVEAHEVDAGKSAPELLNASLRGAGRVYSIGLSGAALPQYLASAAYACASFNPGGLAFFIIGNDFDESLLKYNQDGQLHHFDDDGRLVLTGYELPMTKKVLRHSAFIRYVMYNMVTGARLNQIRTLLGGPGPLASAHAASDEEHLADSKKAVDYFLAQLPQRCSLAPSAILFVLDAVRPEIYAAATMPAAMETSYHARMRAYFALQARARGYEILDMQPVFIERHARDGARFEFPTDKHWNALGHRLVADQVRKSVAYRQVFPSLVRTADARQATPDSRER
jgi:acetyltransferase AlgX (SGNH hydrolase-like protein)